MRGLANSLAPRRPRLRLNTGNVRSGAEGVFFRGLQSSAFRLHFAHNHQNSHALRNRKIQKAKCIALQLRAVYSDDDQCNAHLGPSRM
eukprot:6195240-Pleurochrysis_carterae.AAC.3